MFSISLGPPSAYGHTSSYSNSLAAMPTDLVAQIYLSVDFDDRESLSTTLDGWITSSLRV
jgi:hypothetical protein